MMFMVDILFLIIVAPSLGYLALLSMLALRSRSWRNLPTARLRTFAIVIPAHDEELVIEKTLKSALSINYPKDLFDVAVIADNCSDHTADIARSTGAIVYERFNQAEKGKGYALRWCFDRLLSSEKNYDAVLVVDADSQVSANTLYILNAHLSKGAKAVQIADIVAPRLRSWNSEIVRLAFTLFNVARPLGKERIGCSAGLRGNGMCISAGTLRRIPWKAFSLTEDLEYGLILLLHDINVAFAPEATVVTIMPDKLRNSETQRARWEAGRFPIVRIFAPKLLSAGFRKRTWRYFDALIDLVMLPFVNLMMICLLMIFVHCILLIIGWEKTPGSLWIWITVFGCGIIHVLMGLQSIRADRSLYKALLYVPMYAMWKIKLYLKLIIRGGPDEWLRTKREHREAAVAESLSQRR